MFQEEPERKKSFINHLLELILSHETPTWSTRRLLNFLVFTSCDSNRFGVGQLPLLELLFFCKALLRGAVADCCNTTSVFFDTPSVVEMTAIPFLSCYFAEQSQIVVSPCRFYLRLRNGSELGSYPLIELLLSQNALSRSSPRLFHILVVTSLDFKPGWSCQLSP